MGIYHFDSWAANFGEVTTALELTVEGSGFRFKSRFNKFTNLPELMNIFREVADVQTADMLDLDVPALRGGKPIIVESEPDWYVKQVMEDFVVRAERIRGGGVDPSEDNFLKITHEARLLGTDARLIDKDAPNNPDGKLNKVAENVWKEYEKGNDVFEICSYVDGLEKKIDSMTEELTNMQNQIKEMQEDTFVNNAKKALSEAKERLNTRCEQIKSQVLEVKAQVKSTAKSIVDEAKEKGRAALYRVTEFVGIKKRLLNVRTAVKDMIVSTDRDIARTALLAKGLREAGQTINNAFHTFADKPEVDYSQKEQKHPFTKAVLAPMKAVKKLLVSMELQLDASIDKLDNLAMNVQFDKEKRMEHTKDKDQKAPDTEREIIYSPMVAEPQEYKYNADAFEARKTSEAKQETAGKELPKVREDKAR